VHMEVEAGAGNGVSYLHYLLSECRRTDDFV
jgi:hypothetical protein